MSIDDMQLLEMAEELDEAASFEGCELGEYWRALASFARYAIWGPVDLRRAFIAELQEQHTRLKTEYEFIEEVETVQVKRTVLREKGYGDE